MKQFVQYLKEKKQTVIFCLTMLALFAVTFILFDLPAAAFWYPAVLVLLCACIILAVSYQRYLRQCKRLEELAGMLPEAQLKLPVEGKLGEKLQELNDLLQKQQREERTLANARFRERQEYYTLWAHQIKTPIAAMKLMLEGQDTDTGRALQQELFRIEQYVEMAMTYVRLEDAESDLVICEQDLDEMLKKSFRRFSTEFILRKISLSYEPAEYRFLTDEKWFSFVVGQLLSNALKYTPGGGTVTVKMKQPGILVLSDTGIGIAPEDLPRVFEKGFTGCSGREDSRSSGIGLYLCSRICGRLGIGLHMESRLGEGTEASLDLRQCQVDTRD